MKFDTLFSEKFPDYVHTLQSVRYLCDICGRHLSSVVKENKHDYSSALNPSHAASPSENIGSLVVEVGGVE
jgi:hypothetical protein